MSAAVWHTGDVRQLLAAMPDQSVHSVITSPPYWRKRRYLPTDHPDADKEIGQEPSPGEFLATLLSITDELWRVVRDDGTIWINLGDTAAGSGGAGGDYNEGGERAGQNRWKAASWPTDGMAAELGFPLRKSTCWIPELFGASLAYGRNLLTGDPCRQWVVRPKVTWCKPRVTPGQCDDRFRTATELIVWAAKRRDYYFDAAAIAQERADSPGNRYVRKVSATDHMRRPNGSTAASTDNRITKAYDPATSDKGVPPLDWWVIDPSGYDGAHFATFPPELIIRPVIASCPEGGTILDPFGGSGTTAAVATGHGRNCISFDINESNLDLARERVGMFLTEAEGAPA